MTPTQRAAMQAALDDLVLLFRAANIDHAERPSLAALRAALAEPVVEPVRYLWEQLTFTGECMAWVEVCTTYDPRLDEYRELHQEVKDWGDNRRVRGFMTLYTSPTPPAEVPLLSDFEISDIFQKSNKPGSSHGDFARNIEQAVRQNAGLK